MTTKIRSGEQPTITLAPGEYLRLSTGAGATAIVRRRVAPNINIDGRKIPVGATVFVGPFRSYTEHIVSHVNGDTVSYEIVVGTPGLHIVNAPEDVSEMFGEGAPIDYTDGTPPGTGEGVAGRGSRYTDIAAGALYINTGTQAQPTWTQLAPVVA